MLNADGLVGSTGELLSHNMFAYSKNNPVNMSDPSGFRPIFSASLAEETEGMRRASLATMNNISRKSISIKSQISTLNYMSNDLMNNASRYGKEASENSIYRFPVVAAKYGYMTLTSFQGVREGVAIAIVGLGMEMSDNFTETSINERLTMGVYTAGSYRASSTLVETQANLMAWDSIMSVFEPRPLSPNQIKRMQETINKVEPDDIWKNFVD